MPESQRETETGEVERDRQQRDKGNKSSHNIVSVISQFADDNLSLVRNISTGLAVAGVIIIARSIKLITKFQAAHEIPAHFIERNVSLRGKVLSITEKGIEVEHVPIYLPILSPLLSKKQGCVHISITGTSCRCRADSRGKEMAADELGTCRACVAKTYQSKGCYTALFSVPEQGVNVELLCERRGPQAWPGSLCTHHRSPA